MLGVEKWTELLILGMCTNAGSHARVGEGYSQEFEMKIGVHQGSLLSSLLFISVLEALHVSFILEFPGNLYVDDLVSIADSMEEYVRMLLAWKKSHGVDGVEDKARKTTVTICGTGLGLLQSSDEFRNCAVCHNANTGCIRNADGYYPD